MNNGVMAQSSGNEVHGTTSSVSFRESVAATSTFRADMRTPTFCADARAPI